MAKLKEMRFGAEDAVKILLKTLSQVKYLDSAGAQALATAIGGKLDANDVTYDEATGELTIKGVTVPHLDVPQNGEVGDVLVIKTKGTSTGKPELEWKKIDVAGDIESAIEEALDEDGAIYDVLKGYINKAEYKTTGTGTSEGPCIEFSNVESGEVIAHIPAQPFLRDSFLKSVTIGKGTKQGEVDNTQKDCLIFSFETKNDDATPSNPTNIEVPLEGIFTPGNYFTKTEIQNLLYGEGKESAADADATSIVGRIKALEEKVAKVVFSDEDTNAHTIALTDTAGTKKTLVTSVEGLAKSADVTKEINQAIYGSDTTTAAEGSLAKRLETLENIDFQPITAIEIEKWIKDARVAAGLEEADEEEEDDDDNE